MLQNRYKLSEISVSRISNSLWRRATNILRYIFTLTEKTGPIEKTTRDTCVLVANGPSLNMVDLDALEGHHVFGMNRIYLNDDLKGRLKGIFLVNELVAQQFANDFMTLDCYLYVPLTLSKYFGKATERIIYSRFNPLRGGFGAQSRLHINPGTTVTYYALQILLEMGYRKVIIIGMDHDFGVQNKVNHEEVVIKDNAHFDPNYFPPGSKWDTPDILGNEYWYTVARHHYEKNGALIVDATINGKCKIFVKSALDKEL